MKQDTAITILKALNQIKDVTQYANECQDLRLSDLRALSDAECSLQNILNARQQVDENGNSAYYKNFVLWDDPKAWFNEDIDYCKATLEDKDTFVSTVSR